VSYGGLSAGDQSAWDQIVLDSIFINMPIVLSIISSPSEVDEKRGS
jgi:hypothetical protein